MKFKKLLSLEDIEEMFKTVPAGKQDKLKDLTCMSEHYIILAFANSKFVIVDEMTQAEQLTNLKYDEFLEFIARVADLATFEPEPDQI